MKVGDKVKFIGKDDGYAPLQRAIGTIKKIHLEDNKTKCLVFFEVQDGFRRGWDYYRPEEDLEII